MKFARNTNLLVRLGVAAAAILLSQHALAVGTDAGVTVSNQASVAYSVSGTGQTPIESDPAGNSTPGAGSPTEFLVDRRVDFSVAGDQTIDAVAPGSNGHTFDFTLTNDSNGTMDFLVTLTQLGSADGAFYGNTDTDDDLSNVTLEGNPVATFYVDDLAEDGTFDINVVGDAAAALVNGDVALIEISVVAYDPSGNSGAPVALTDDTASADDPAAVDNVFADTGNDNSEADVDGVSIESAELVITKTSTAIEDPLTLLGVTTEAHAIPDAVVQYTVTIDNSGGAVAADNITVTDTIQVNDVLFEAGHYPGGGDATLDGTECTADAGDGNGDGCAYDGTDTYTFTIASIPAGNTVTITYRVRVNPANP